MRRLALADARAQHRACGRRRLALLALLLLEVPKTLTLAGLQMAVHEDARMQTRGIRLLRAAGDRDVCWRVCYWRSNIGTDAASALFNTLGAKVSEEARPGDLLPGDGHALQCRQAAARAHRPWDMGEWDGSISTSAAMRAIAHSRAVP